MTSLELQTIRIRKIDSSFSDILLAKIIFGLSTSERVRAVVDLDILLKENRIENTYEAIEESDIDLDELGKNILIRDLAKVEGKPGEYDVYTNQGEEDRAMVIALLGTIPEIAILEED